MQPKHSIVFVLLFFALAARSQNPCVITASTYHGCIPLIVQFQFKTTNTSAAVSYNWNFGDGTTSKQDTPTHIYKNAGKNKVSVTVTFANGTTCTDTMARPVIIYSNPAPAFTINHNNPVLLCRRGDSICFQDNSVPGPDHAPIASWLWSFGDGSSSTKENPCYAYSDSGVYVVTLQVTDTNGCPEYIQKKVNVRYTTDVGINPSPSFQIYISYDCKKNIDLVKFTNLTDTAGQYITRFVWYFGDGTGDTCTLQSTPCLSKWTNFIHQYPKSGSYKPFLFVENKYGCSNYYFLDTPITVNPYILNVSTYPPMPQCFASDSSASFMVPYDPLARDYLWDFGDPYRRAPGVLSATGHTYPYPGVYTIHVEVQIGNCYYDSTVCDAVVLKGPIALIMPVKGSLAAWNVVPPNGSYLIPPSDYPHYFDTSCLAPVLVQYYTYAPTLIKNGEPVYDPCKVDTIKKYNPDSLYSCTGKKVPDIIDSFVRHINSYKDTTINVATAHIWVRGDPVPTGNLYSDTPYVRKPLYMDDTSLFSVRCKAPQKISFTNFSDKYRGYYAVDNFPPGYPDKCLNKSYPYASDSLTYFWDFGEGRPTTSSRQAPVDTDRYSNEILPTHLFRKNGCYWVKLVVTDTATNCSDIDSVPVVLQTPDAGWAPEYSKIKHMTSVIQDSLPGKGPRRGFIIGGPPCVGDTQFIDLSETLPSCYKVDFSVVLDSAAQVDSCQHQKSEYWLHKSFVQDTLNYAFQYGDTGWVTVGLVVRNNYNCTDTVWYHDYKYIHGTYPAIALSAHTICAGDTLRMAPLVPKQLGIQTFVYYFYEIEDRGDTIAKFKNDTIPYKLVKRAGGKYDTITSTVHNRLWGIDDGALNFDNLTDSFSIPVAKPGHFLINTVIISRFGCVDTAKTEVMVGHYSEFNVDNNIVCTNDTLHFQGLAQYFLPFTPFNTGYSSIMYWQNPDSARNGRKPLIPELMQWDFNGDGIIDATGPHPYYIYTKPGVYTINLYTTDSNGCRQTLTKKNFITVIGDSAFFKVAAPGLIQYCNGAHFFQFIDSSHIIKPPHDSLNNYKIYSWTWDFGDGTPTITITDSNKKNASHYYFKSGDYTVKLVVNTLPGTGANGRGCKDSFQVVVHILGPVSNFKIIGPNKGCVPFTLVVKDLSKKATVRDWFLGDGTTYSSNADSIIRLTYVKPGIFCPQLFVSATIVDSLGDSLYCADTFPAKCKFKVEVYDTNKQVLTASDTLLCAGRDSVYFRSAPDTGYSTWTIHYDNGDSVTQSNPYFGYIYNKIGKYHVTIDGSGAKCPDTAAINVRVIDIKSLFSIDTAKNDTPFFSFKNLSVGGKRYTWDFGDGTSQLNTTSNQEITHEFMKAGRSTICLTAYNEKGCEDKYCEDIAIDTFLFIPNVFTPNGDSYNPFFDIIIYGSLVYHLDIYNRWGQQVFQSENKNNMWDGTNKSTGKLYPEGTYYYVFKYHFIGSRDEVREGAVTLLR